MTINEKLVSDLRDLRLKLHDLTEHGVFFTHEKTKSADIFVSPHELNDSHGTGVLLRRIFGKSEDIFAIRSANHCGPMDFGDKDILINHRGGTRSESLSNVARGMHGISARRIFIVPYHSDEVMTALALKDLSGAPLCTWLMDDQNVFSSGLSDDLMLELLSKSSLRLAISPELREAYESNDGLKIWLALPVVEPDSIRNKPSRTGKKEVSEKRGILIGNIWSPDWLEHLRRTIRGTGMEIDFYGPFSCQPWLDGVRHEMEADGIRYLGYLPQDQLVDKLQTYPYALALTGTFDDAPDRLGIAKFSLPSRIPYIMAVSNTPLIVLGNEGTCAARFVKRFDIGMACPYDTARFREAVDYVCTPEAQKRFRESAVQKAAVFNADGFSDWIWKSLEQGRAMDDRFENFVSGAGDSMKSSPSPFIPQNLISDFRDIYQVLHELKINGHAADFVVDVGSSLGVWSDTARAVHSQARFILVDPLNSEYEDLYRKRQDFEFEVVEAAISNECGKAAFQVSKNLHGSSLSKPGECGDYQAREVKVMSLDKLAGTMDIKGSGILKINVQNGERLVLEGAGDFIKKVDVLVVELLAARYDKSAKSQPDLVQQIESLGFQYYKEAAGWRSPMDGSAVQHDLFFVKKPPAPVSSNP